MKKLLLTALLSSLMSFAIISFTAIETQNSISDSGLESSYPEGKSYPADWAWLQRTYPHFNADPRAHLDALEQAQKMRREIHSDRLNKSARIAWEFAGPVNIGGRIADIEFNPVDPSIVYAASSTGGVFKSTDTGETWFPVFDEQSVLPAGDIAIDPQNPDIVYVGTGEPNGSHNNFPGGGVFKSTDAGSTWENIGLELSAHVGRIVIDPADPQRLFVAAVGSNFGPNPERGLYRSINSGTSWEKVLFVNDSTGAIDVVMDPNNPDFLLAAMWQRSRRAGYGQSETSYGPSSGIFRTIDGGDTWNKLGPVNGLPDDNSGVGRIGLAISYSSPNIAYAVYTDGGTYSGLYKTTNYGDNWTNADPDLEVSIGVSSFSWYFGQVRVDYTDPEIVYILDVSFMRSTNSGDTWPIIYGYGGPDQLHVDHHALAIHPTDPDYLINGNDGGINISTDKGQTWSDPKELPNTQFYEIGLDATNPERLYGGTQDNNTIRTPGGFEDDWERILGGDGFYVNVDFNNPNIIYAEYQYGSLFKSTNGGSYFFVAMNGISGNEPTNWSTPVVMDPNNSLVLYYGTNRLYRTTNGAQSWTPISGVLVANNPLLPRFGTLTTIAVAPSNSNYIYVGTDDSRVWVTKDYGNTWDNISQGLPDRWVTRVAVDPENEEKVYVTFSGLKWKDPEARVFKSSNAGAGWTDISGNLPDAPVNAIAIDFNNTDIIYLGSDVGAFVSFDNGGSWETLGEGLPVVSVYDLKIHPSANYLAAGTHGRSMYKIDLNQVVSVETEKMIADNYILTQNYPNPFNPTTKIKFTISESDANLASPSEISLKVYDILGNLVTTLIDDPLSAGSYEVEFNAEGLASGIYLYRLDAGEFSAVRKMMLLK